MQTETTNIVNWSQSVLQHAVPRAAEPTTCLFIDLNVRARTPPELGPLAPFITNFMSKPAAGSRSQQAEGLRLL
ncbi:hypothetical protein E2C01_088477 [Portunus trituberculatus]|uniref:Uncharacterized protein n=1 Tax=Portunus trituberculatus TaxID=210409 RepID=A0A5B7JAW1_PORTR|nr:hypothetical protein [Portunus trituberculatus]